MPMRIERVGVAREPGPEELVLRPRDRSGQAVYQFNLWTHGLEIEEVLRVDRSDLLSTPDLLKVTGGERGRLTCVVPTLERRDQDR